MPRILTTSGCFSVKVFKSSASCVSYFCRKDAKRSGAGFFPVRRLSCVGNAAVCGGFLGGEGLAAGALRRGFGRCSGFGSAPGFALARGAVAGFRFAAGLARGGGRFSLFGLARGIGVTRFRPLNGAPASGIGLFFVIASGVA